MHRVISLCLGLVVFVLNTHLPLRALRPDRPLIAYGLHAYSTENGLPQSAVMALCQVHSGFIWVGTYEGLARFNGMDFRVFDKSNVRVMQNNSIKCFLEDHQGRLWIGTPNGLMIFSNGQFRMLTTREGLSGDFILSVFQDARRRIWAGATNGLNLLGDQGAVPVSLGKNTSSNYITAISEDSQGRLWVGTDDGLLVSSDPLKAEWKQVLPHDVRVLYGDRDGGVYVGTSGNGLFHFSSATIDSSRPIPQPGGNDVRALYQDLYGALWVGTNGGGLVRVHKNRAEVLTSRQGLPGDSIRSIIEDHEGSLWVGTRNGLVQLTDDRYILFDSRNGLPVDEVRCVLPGTDGDMWIGTVEGGLVHYSKGKFESLTEREGLRSERIWSLASDPRGGVWIGTYGGGLHHLDRSGRMRVWDKTRGMPNDIIRAILVEENGRVWAATNGGGVAVLENDRVVKCYSRENGMPSDFVYAIARDQAGHLWFGTYDAGLVELADGRLRIYGSEYGLDSHAIWTIYPDKDRNLWLGTDDGGLKRFYHGRVDTYTIRDGLYSDSAFQIVEDGGGRLWMNCNKGVYNVHIRDLLAFSAGKINQFVSTSYGRAEGLRAIETSGPAQPAGCRDFAGRMWFSTINGVAVFDPEWQPEKDIQPPVAIERILINRNEYFPGDDIVAAPGRGRLEVEYTGFSFRLPAALRFRYRLKGHEDDWIDAGNRRFAAITNLSPGIYRFEVATRLVNGDWSREPAAFSFHLEPHFHQTYWFYILVVLIVLGLMGLVYRFNLKQLHRRQRQLSQMIEERTSQLNTANRRLNQTNVQLQEANMKLKHLAHMDGVTQIANHRFFLETLEKEWRMALRRPGPIALVFADIDFFKDFNDTHGHQEGDRCLQRVAGTIQACVKRPRDFVARYGGEEFVVILPDTSADGARVMAENLRIAVESLQIPHGASSVSSWVTISLGVAARVPDAQETAMSLLRAADQALYAAKRGGRNMVAVEPESK
ncbi:MAG: diguanylate cyclase [Candidatus Aminicenantes bacterium]|nr:diguanylate cyclase [Candidatus Aminicenantes bacterium]